MIVYMAVDDFFGAEESRKTAVVIANTGKNGAYQSKGNTNNIGGKWVSLILAELMATFILGGSIRVMFWIGATPVGYALWHWYGRGFWIAEGENTSLKWIRERTAVYFGPDPIQNRIQIIFSSSILVIITGIQDSHTMQLIVLAAVAILYRQSARVQLLIMSLMTWNWGIALMAIYDLAPEGLTRIRRLEGYDRNGDQTVVSEEVRIGGNSHGVFDITLSPGENRTKKFVKMEQTGQTRKPLTKQERREIKVLRYLASAFTISEQNF